MPTTTFPPASQRSYVVFVKLWSLGPGTPADEAQALFDHLDLDLRCLADNEEQDWFPSPYGGAIAVRTVDEAIHAANDLISALSDAGIQVSIAVGRGRLDRVKDVNRWNVTALAMNIAARMANLDAAKGNVLVEPVVREDAIASQKSFAKIFGPKEQGKVKRTQLEYHRIIAPGYGQPENLQFQFNHAHEHAQTADIICFDIERYSECGPDVQNDLVNSLSGIFECVLTNNNCRPDDFGPAGDGGYVAFLQKIHHPSATTWSVVKQLSELAAASQIPLRIGVSTGPVLRAKFRPAVGGAVLRADKISSHAPRDGIAVGSEFWSELPIANKNDWYVQDSVDDLRAHSLGRGQRPQPSNPRAFYSGGSASDGDIAAELDIPRTQFVRTWSNERGESQKAWRERLLADIRSPRTGFRVVALYGHRGSGKTTLCRRMIRELRAAAIPVVDLLALPLGLGAALSEVSSLSAAGQEPFTHVFIEVDSISSNETLSEYLRLVRHFQRKNPNFTIFAAVDTNQWKQIQSRLGSSTRNLGGRLEEMHLRGRLDEYELSELISRLKKHGCLFRLEQKSDEAIRFTFLRKAKRGLLTSLIEATRETDSQQDLGSIVWEEFRALNNKAQWAYALVAMLHASSLPVPRDVLEQALKPLTGDARYFASPDFINETAEILFSQGNLGYVARHALVAVMLLKKLSEQEWEEYQYRILRAVLEALDLSRGEHERFFDLINERKVARCVTDLSRLTDEIGSGRIPNIQARHISQFLNSVVRIYQGRGRYDEGEKLAARSLQNWNHVGNQASYLLAFCQYKLGKLEEVERAVGALLEAEDYPYHVLHGIALLCVLQQWPKAKTALDNFEARHGDSVSEFADYRVLRKKVELFLNVNWSDSNLDALAPKLALERIEFGEEQSPQELVVTQYRALVRRQHDFFRAFLAFFTYLNRSRPDEEEQGRLARFRLLEEECRYHIGQHEGHFRKYSDETLSLLHSNLGRSLFAIDKIAENSYLDRKESEEHFQAAIKYKATNWYAHNWYGTFLKEAKGDRPGAERHYDLAVRGDPEQPVFKYNLALLFYEDKTFARQRLEIARGLANEALTLCGVKQAWNDFAYWPQQLVGSLTLLLARADVRDGDELDRDYDLLGDVE